MLIFYVLLFGVVYLAWWDFKMDPTIEQHQIFCKSRKKWLDKRSRRKAWAVHGKSKLRETEECDTGEEQSQEHAHNFRLHQGDCSQRIRPGRPNNHFHNYYDILRQQRENVSRLRPKLWRQKNWLLHLITQRLTLQGILTITMGYTSAYTDHIQTSTSTGPRIQRLVLRKRNHTSLHQTNIVNTWRRTYQSKRVAWFDVEIF
jgi:hypothetical protein